MTSAFRSALLALALAAASLATAGAAHAQDPRPTPRDTVPRPRPDTLPRDTLRRPPRDSAQVAIPPEAVRGDTLPEAIVGQDTLPPDSTIAAPLIPAHPLPPVFGFSDGSFLFDRRALGYFHGLSVAELLERIPGIGLTRAGSFGRPLAVSPFFAGGGRFRIFLDGWELRPMNGATPDLQRIPIVNLESVRVQRGLSEIRVDLSSLRLGDARPLALIEGMDGDYDTRALRGLFTRPIGSRWLAELALDLVETDGFLRREPYSSTHSIGRLSYAFSPDFALQAEYRGSKIDARRQINNQTLEFESYDRRETLLRARGRFLGRLSVEAVLGRSSLEPASAEDTTTRALESLQLGVRAAAELRFGQLSGGVRLHRADEESSWAPDASELWARLDFTPAPFLAATGEVRALTLGGVSGVETEATVRAGPWGGFSLFGSLAAGSRGVRFIRDTSLVLQTIGGIVGHPGVPTLDTVPVAQFATADPSLNAFRAGAELARGRVRLGAAFVSSDLSALVPYGFPFERGFNPAEGDRQTGVEGYLSIPLLRPELRLEGWYQRWLGDADRRYMPTQLGWVALEFTDVYRGGNLEPLIRVEVVGRDQALGPNPLTGQEEATQRYGIVNTYVQIRILDIRIFWRLENAFNQRRVNDLPGTELPGSRALYGVRWFFRN